MRALLFAATALFPLSALGELKVVTSFSILTDLAKQVGGDLVQVTSIVGPGQDAHIYSPSIADAKAVADAQLVIFNGIGFETWAEDLVAASGTSAHILTVTDSLPLDVHGEEEGHEEEGHEAHGEEGHKAHGEEAHEEHSAESFSAHDHGGEDPHAWNAIANAIAYVQAIEIEFAELDPENAATFAANADAYIATLSAMQNDYAARIAALPADHRTVVTTHDAFGYLAEETGLTFLAAKGVNSASAASAGQINDLISQLNSLPHAALFVEGIANPALITQIAEETGYEVGGKLYSDALTDASGPAQTYEAMYRHNMESILGALEAGL